MQSLKRAQKTTIDCMNAGYACTFGKFLRNLPELGISLVCLTYLIRIFPGFGMDRMSHIFKSTCNPQSGCNRRNYLDDSLNLASLKFAKVRVKFASFPNSASSM